MFIYNLKLSGTKIFKFVFIIIIIIVITLCGIVCYKVYNASFKSNAEIPYPEIAEITPENYTNILKMVHDDVDTYLGQKIKFTGFVYRVYDLDINQFVLGRNMIISSDNQTVTVGFLCKYKDSILFKDNTWIEIEGKIEKTEYHGCDIPILEITKIKEINKPEKEFVYPPNDDYIPTSVIL